MTKKHFIALADGLRATKPAITEKPTLGECFLVAQWRTDASRIADICFKFNRQFNRQRWLDYIDDKCGPNGGKLK